MALPRLWPEESGDSTPTDSVLLAVYAPFGTDETLSTYPEGSSQTLAQHPLYQGLLKVAAQGIHVAALIDRVDDDTGWSRSRRASRPRHRSRRDGSRTWPRRPTRRAFCAMPTGRGRPRRSCSRWRATAPATCPRSTVAS
ncbi:hypothetical protein FSC37_15125 [Piscinibacter aquaticus]|uniref:Uncharacterized protein n=1 Tax=Piscinibacter aquaticus TaxID=392597 RepID=A0A5C6U121_9BURK|nr:hypothetical protein FSC37_15125 [Piscinibacter aquaticus]